MQYVSGSDGAHDEEREMKGKQKREKNDVIGGTERRKRCASKTLSKHVIPKT